MKATVLDRFGPPDVLQMVDADLPEVGADDVLVWVHAAALNPAGWHIVRDTRLSRVPARKIHGAGTASQTVAHTDQLFAGGKSDRPRTEVGVPS